jgi:hypothetical protein
LHLCIVKGRGHDLLSNDLLSSKIQKKKKKDTLKRKQAAKILASFQFNLALGMVMGERKLTQ